MGLTVGQFIEIEMKSSGIRSTSLLAKPQLAQCVYATIKDMPIEFFVEHCRGWHLLGISSCGVNFVVKLSKRLKDFGINWG